MAVEPTAKPARAKRPRGKLIDQLAARAAAAAPHATESIVVDAPATGLPIGKVPRGTPEDIAAAVRRSREVQREWARVPVSERCDVLMRFHNLVFARRRQVLDLLQLEGGKARIHAFEEVLDAGINARYYSHTAAGFLETKKRQGVMPFATEVWEHHHPRGVIGFIVPWNYPLALGVGDALPALVAGNGAVVKPDAQTPFSALWAFELLEECGLPPGLAQVVTGEGSELGASIVEHSDYVMFTGSTRVGRIVASQAGELLTECSMELGGKNAMIVLADADLERTATGAMRAAFTNAGQLCVSMERLYVQEDVHDEFVRRLVEHTRALRLGGELGWDSDVGSLMSDKQLHTVTAHVEDAVAKGATVLAGGRPRPDIGPRFYEPTVLADVTPEMTAFAEETFGPVISVYKFKTADEAVELANASTLGLNFSVWGHDTDAARDVAVRLEAGTVNINEGYAAAWASVDAPMGGFKDSGFGRRHGAHGIHKYTQSQTIAVQHRIAVSTAPGPDARKQALRLVNALKLSRYLPGTR
jgi:succinate-semialdehyde dehydrogenase/glutarate-semialdehyde dehydrogenase